MSFKDGWAAINLEKPKRIPRTEASVESHWNVLKAVTGIDVNLDSSDQIKDQARRAFYKAWNYDFYWNVVVTRNDFGEMRTKIGHAEFLPGGIDYDNDISCPFKTPEEVLSFDPIEVFGRQKHADLVDRFETKYDQACEHFLDGVNMTGVYVTLVSGLIELFGWDMLLLAAGTDMGRFGKLANRYAKWIQQFFDAFADSDIPVVMVHDDIAWTTGPFMAPQWYREYVFPNYKKYFAPLIDSDKKVLFTSDGNFDCFVDDIVETGVNGFVMEPLTDMAYIADKYGKTHVIIGNADTRILLLGTKEDIRKEVERCINIGKDCPGYFMSVTNHIPANTPVENVLYYNRVYEELSKR